MGYKKSDIDAFVIERQVAQNSLYHLRDILPTLNQNQIKARAENLKHLWDKFDNAQTKLENVDFTIYGHDRIAFEDIYFELKAEFDLVVESLSSESKKQQLNLNSVTETVSSSVKLPQLNLPNFTGDYQTWTYFRDVFNALVHNNEHITPIQKLYYLKNCLREEPLKLIQSITASADNYKIAYDTLCERYDNTSFIANSHLQALFALPIVSKDNNALLRKLLTESKQHLKSLSNLGIPTENWDVIIIYILNQKLDTNSRRDWELSRVSKKLSTLSEFYTFLEHRCQALEMISQESNTYVNLNSNKITKTKIVHHTTTPNWSKGNSSFKCFLCKKPHQLYHCDEFQTLPVPSRINVIKKHNVCFNCLRGGHNAKTCNSKGCHKCYKKHHTLIHFQELSKDSPVVESSNHNVSNEIETVQSNFQDINEAYTSKVVTSNTVLMTSTNYCEEYQVLLATALIRVKTAKGNWITCRALLDPGSQAIFVRITIKTKFEFNKCEV